MIKKIFTISSFLLFIFLTVTCAENLPTNNDELGVRLYPAEFGRANTLPLVRNTPSFARFLFVGNPQIIKDELFLIIKMPKGTGDFDLLGNKTEVEINGESYIQFRVKISDDVIKQITPQSSHAIITVWFETSSMPKSGKILYSLEVDGKLFKEKKAIVKVLPPLPEGKRPEHFKTFSAWGSFKNVPKILRKSVLEMLQKMGPTAHLISDKTPWIEYLAKNLSKVGGEPWGNIKYQKEVSTMFYDWEPHSAIQKPHWEDMKSRAEFAKQNNIDLSFITTKRLKGELRDKWFRFRNIEIVSYLKNWAKEIHKIDPDMKFAVAQGSGMPIANHIDYKLYNDIPNLTHMPMIYTSNKMGLAKNLMELRKYLPSAKIFPFISSSMVIDKGWFMSSSPKTIYSHFITSALLGNVGCAYWPDLNRGFDMEYVWEVAKAMRDIGSIENFLVNGEETLAGLSVKALYENEAHLKVGNSVVDIVEPQWNRNSISGAYRLGDDILFYFNNFYEDKLATVEVKIKNAKDGNWYLYNPINKKLLVPQNGKTWSVDKLKAGVVFETNPNDLGVLVASQKLPESISTEVVNELAIRTAFNLRSEKAKAETNLEAMKQGELEINWADMDGDGNAEIRLANSKQELGFGKHGNLWSWKVGDKKQEFVNRFDGSGAFEDRYWWPKGARSSSDGRSDYELVSRKIENGKAIIVMRRDLTHSDLGNMSIEKEYSIKEGDTKIELKVTINNETPDNHIISYWSHNTFLVGNIPVIAVDTKNGKTIIDGSVKEKDRRFVRADLTEDELKFIIPRGERPEDIKQKLEEYKKIRFTTGKFILGTPNALQLIINTDYDEMLQMFRWWDKTDKSRYTIEWVYKATEIKSGHSWSTKIDVEVK